MSAIEQTHDANMQPNDGMSPKVSLAFSQPDMAALLGATRGTDLDELTFGVIGFDPSTIVRIYNTFESNAAGLPLHLVVGQPLFTAVAPCMNNFMVAQRYEDAASAGTALDETIDYVLTLRMRPVKVRLRMLSNPGATLRYLLVGRSA